MNRQDLLEIRPEGLYCPEGDFFIDPHRPVDRAVITHAHADHARAGSRRYLTTRRGRSALQKRLGADAAIDAVGYGETVRMNRVAVSLHPAGHILGSAQVRLHRDGEVWVVTGDFKTAPDPTCEPFEPVVCHTLVTESTFGLPVFRWPPAERVMGDIRSWWVENRERGRTSLLHVYALGKAQRVLASLAGETGPVLVHGAVAALNGIYEEEGLELCPHRPVSGVSDRDLLSRALVLAPASAAQPGWLRRFPSVSEASASGWMQIRGFRRRRALDRGFVLSDHADWPGLLGAVEASGAERVWALHGFARPFARYLSEKGLDARAVEVRAADGDEPGDGEDLG
jgi:putative mRNA 3-end processing factor